MARWEVMRDVRDNRIIMIRPVGFKGWGTGDKALPLAVVEEELGLTYFDKDAISLEKGGDGLTKTAKDLRQASSLAEIVIEKPAEVSAALTVAQLDAEIQRRGYKPISLAQAVAAEG